MPLCHRHHHHLTDYPYIVWGIYLSVRGSYQTVHLLTIIVLSTDYQTIIVLTINYHYYRTNYYQDWTVRLDLSDAVLAVFAGHRQTVLAVLFLLCSSHQAAIRPFCTVLCRTHH